MSNAQTVKFPASTMLSEATYDPTLGVLSVTFKNSRQTYDYFEVPLEKVMTLFATAGLGAGAGHYFTKEIRSAYRFERAQ
jgi:KTSC domain